MAKSENASILFHTYAKLRITQQAVRILHKKNESQVKDLRLIIFLVGVTRLELATSRPPDAYSNQLSYTPISEKRCKVKALFSNMQANQQLFCIFSQLQSLSHQKSLKTRLKSL